MNNLPTKEQFESAKKLYTDILRKIEKEDIKTPAKFDMTKADAEDTILDECFYSIEWVVPTSNPWSSTHAAIVQLTVAREGGIECFALFHNYKDLAVHYDTGSVNKAVMWAKNVLDFIKKNDDRRETV